MQKLFNFIIEKRYLFLSLFLLLAGLCVTMIDDVNINNDMTAYLPEDSQTRVGYDILEDEFGTTSSLKIVFEDLNSDELENIYSDLTELEYVSSVEYDETETYNVDEYSMFIIRIGFAATSEEAMQVLDTVAETFPDAIVGGEIFISNESLLSPYLLVLALIILLILLFTFTSSWIEPFLFLVTIGIAVLINMGTNVVFDSISEITNSIASLLQLCLSINYSIMMVNRYRQEKQKESDKIQAMKNAMGRAFQSISGSSLTTIVGLSCLAFMSFKIGADLGLVLAKGVFISALTVFFVLPTLILLFDKAISNSTKLSIHIEAKKLSGFGYKLRKVAPVMFILLFVGSFFLSGNTETSYVLPTSAIDEASNLFPDDNALVIIYDNDDEESVNEILSSLSDDENVLEVLCYANTIGQEMTATDLAYYTGMDETQLIGMLTMSGYETISIYDFTSLILENYLGMLSAAQAAQLNATREILVSSTEQFVGEEYSRIIITTDYALDSESTNEFVAELEMIIEENLSEDYYILGTSAMAYEMSGSFDEEFLLITILTIVAIFVIVAFTFKSFLIPTVLVTIIQTAIFLTTATLGLLGDNVYFLALLIIQAILMGATIDYGILFTSYFRETDPDTPIKDVLKHAYKGSTHTILTSASILFCVTGLLGLVASDPTILQVCRALAVGTLTSTLLILFVLPSILVFMRKGITKKRKMIETE